MCQEKQRKLSDEQIKLIEDNYDCVGLIMKLRHLYQNDIEDWHGLLSEALIKSVLLYKPNNHCSARTFIINALNLAVKCQRCNYSKAKMRNGICLSLYEPITVDTNGDNLYIADIIGNEDINYEYSDLRAACESVLADYSDQHKEIIKLYYQYFMTTRETGALTNVSREIVSRVTRKFINDLRKELLNI